MITPIKGCYFIFHKTIKKTLTAYGGGGIILMEGGPIMDQNSLRREEVKKEKQRKKKGDLNVKAIKYAFGCQIIKFEKRMFGWHYQGHTVDDDVTYSVTDNGKIKKNHKIIKYAYFNRPKVWKTNFLFTLTETLSKIVSFFRRLYLNLIVVMIVLMIIGFMGDDKTLGIVVLCIGLGLIALSFLLAGLGTLWKKVFKLEEKTDEIFTANGFDVWSSNEEGENLD